MKSYMVPLILAVLIICCIFGMYFLWVHTDQQLEEAKADTERAKLALSMATAYSKQIETELRETIYKANEATEKSKARVKWLETSFDQAKKELQQATTDKAELQAQIDNIPITPPADIPTEEILAQAAQLYPGNDFTGVEATANREARDLFQMMIAEITERRKLSLINDKIIGEQQDQILRCGEITEELRLQLGSAGQIRQALENANEALRLENGQYIEVNQALEKQISLLEKKQRFQWIQRPAVAIALIGGILIGKEIVK